MKRTVLIAGASGLVGGCLLELLLADDEVARVVSLVRRASGGRHPKLVERTIDFDRLDELAIDPPVHDVACCLGTTMRAAGSREAFRRVDLDYVLALGRLARRLGAGTLSVVSSLGADPRSRSFYLRTKGEAEQALEALGLPALVVLRPSLLVGRRDRPRPGERVAEVGLRMASPLLGGRLRRYRPVAATAVARAMIQASRAPGGPVRVVESDQIVALGAR